MEVTRNPHIYERWDRVVIDFCYVSSNDYVLDNWSIKYNFLFGAANECSQIESKVSTHHVSGLDLQKPCSTCPSHAAQLDPDLWFLVMNCWPRIITVEEVIT